MTIWVSFTPLWACICFATCWLPYRKRYYIVSRWNVFTIWLLKSICGIRYQVKGMENLPDELAECVRALSAIDGYHAQKCQCPAKKRDIEQFFFQDE